MANFTHVLLRSAIVTSLLAGACTGAVTGQQDPALVCVDPGAPISPGAWTCGVDRTVECEGPDGAAVGPVIVVPVALGTSSPPPCSAVTLTSPTPLSSGPLAIGDHVVTVYEHAGSLVGVACSSTLHVVDTTPPVATALSTELWPPNHKMHDIAIGDCVHVADICDEAVQVHFTYVSSDESTEVHGSGHTDPDVELVDCTHVRVRAERAGGSDGRVYHLGYEATDHAGNSSTGSCRVVVPHDQGGDAPLDSAEAYRVDVPACL